MLDLAIVALSGLAAGIAIGAGPVLVYRASYRAARADADRVRARLATSMVLHEAAKFTGEMWKNRALAAEWDTLGCPALPPADNVVNLASRRSARVPAAISDRSA